MTSPEVLHERVTLRDHAGTAVGLEPAHWSQPRLEPGMIGLNPIVRIPRSVVGGAWEELIDDGEECPCPIGDHLGRLAVCTQS